MAFLSHPLAPVLAAAALLAACSADEPGPDEQEAAARVPGAPPGAVLDLRARRAAADVRQSDDLIEFAYAYPRDAAAIQLAEWLTMTARRGATLLAGAARPGGSRKVRLSHAGTVICKMVTVAIRCASSACRPKSKPTRVAPTE